ncbi:MAG: hypothetical protein HN391_05345, partial [Anaerolineae bacterium]|nr:hypothetical protein [Anaerolineae bacterium]
MTQNRISIIAIALAVVGIVAGGFSLYRANILQSELAIAIEEAAERSRVANERIGAVPIEPAHPTTIENVALDPSILPPPIKYLSKSNLVFCPNPIQH